MRSAAAAAGGSAGGVDGGSGGGVVVGGGGSGGSSGAATSIFSGYTVAPDQLGSSSYNASLYPAHPRYVGWGENLVVDGLLLHQVSEKKVLSLGLP